MQKEKQEFKKGDEVYCVFIQNQRGIIAAVKDRTYLVLSPVTGDIHEIKKEFCRLLDEKYRPSKGVDII